MNFHTAKFYKKLSLSMKSVFAQVRERKKTFHSGGKNKEVENTN